MKIIMFLFCFFICISIAFSQTEFEKIIISKEIELLKISDRALVHVSYIDHPKYGRIGANGLILIDENKAFLFDSPWNDSQTQELVEWLSDSIKVKVMGFIPNHWHEDCMGGLKYLQEQGIKSYANQMTLDIAKEKGLPIPDHGFTDSLKLEFGSQEIECFYFGGAHATDNIVVWIPKEKILFPGCMVKSTGSTNLGNTKDEDLRAYPQTIQKILDQFTDSLVVIPGHGSPGGIDYIAHTLKLAIQ